jgi:hypothetical protein
MLGCDSLNPHTYAGRHGEFGVINGERRIALTHNDIDEAMARFAALVLATEGMVSR